MCFCRSAVSVKTFFWLFSPRLLGAYKHAAPALLEKRGSWLSACGKKMAVHERSDVWKCEVLQGCVTGAAGERPQEVNRHWTKGTAQSGREANALRGIEKGGEAEPSGTSEAESITRRKKLMVRKTQKLELIPPSIDPCAVKGTDKEAIYEA